jgi:hypothetical protein
MWLVDPVGSIVHHQQDLTEAEDTLFFRVQPGPWELCFQQRAPDGQWRPSAQIHLDYFDVAQPGTPASTQVRSQASVAALTARCE